MTGFSTTKKTSAITGSNQECARCTLAQWIARFGSRNAETGCSNVARLYLIVGYLFDNRAGGTSHQWVFGLGIFRFDSLSTVYTVHTICLILHCQVASATVQAAKSLSNKILVMFSSSNKSKRDIACNTIIAWVYEPIQHIHKLDTQLTNKCSICPQSIHTYYIGNFTWIVTGLM